jgi:hypothetical protein
MSYAERGEQLALIFSYGFSLRPALDTFCGTSAVGLQNRFSIAWSGKFRAYPISSKVLIWADEPDRSQLQAWPRRQS